MQARAAPPGRISQPVLNGAPRQMRSPCGRCLQALRPLQCERGQRRRVHRYKGGQEWLECFRFARACANRTLPRFSELREAEPAAAEMISAPRILSQLPGKSVVP